MVKQIGNEYGSYPVSQEGEMNRRNFIIGGAIAAVGLGGVLVGRSMGGNSEQQPESPNVAIDQPDGEAGSEEIANTNPRGEQSSFSINEITRSPNLFAGRRDPDEMRELYEESLYRFGYSLKVKEKDVPTPEAFPEVFEERMNAVLVLGCTLIEVEPYLELNSDPQVQAQAMENYLNEMADKYDYAVFTNMCEASAFGGTGAKMSPQEARSNSSYKIISRSCRSARRRFLAHLRREGNLNETTKITVVDHEVPHVLNSGFYGMGMNVRFSNKVNDGDTTRQPYSIEGKIDVSVDPDKQQGTLNVLFSGQPENIIPFEELYDR